MYKKARRSLHTIAMSAIILLNINPIFAATFDWTNVGVADNVSIPNGTTLSNAGITMIVNQVLEIDGVVRPLSDIAADGTIASTGGSIDFNTINSGGPISYAAETIGAIAGGVLHMEMEQSATCDASDKLILQLSFEDGGGNSVGVRDLAFTLIDIDELDFDDAIEVFVNGVNAKIYPGLVITTNGTIDPTQSVASGLDGWDGNSNIGDASPAANIIFDFSNAADEAVGGVEIRYSSNQPCDDGLDTPSNQKVALSNITTSNTTTPVTLNRFRASSNGNQVNFEWESSNEVGHAGYQIYALIQGRWQMLNESLITTRPGPALSARQHHYSAQASGAKWFALVDVSSAEDLSVHGPYRLNNAYGTVMQPLPSFDWEAIKTSDPSKNKVLKDSVSMRLSALLEKDERTERIRSRAQHGGVQ